MITPSKSVLLCDVPFLEGIETDLPFRTHNADVPEDLLACTPIHGWDSPPDSPAHVSVEMLEGVDPMLGTKLSTIFDDGSGEPLYDWTPPASPEPSSDCDDMLREFPDLNVFGMMEHVDETESAASGSADSAESPRPVSQKRKASSISGDDREKKRIRDKQEQARVARTEACEQAVADLIDSKNDEDPESKRHTHNVLERKRRNDLKNSYQLLRERVPSLEDDDRAPTGKILLHACEFIAHLKKTDAVLADGLALAQAENERLRRKAGLL
jgi:Myc proto-oncogene protein